MAYSSEDLIAALSGGRTFREKALPEASDFNSWLISAYTPSQTSILASLLDPTKDALLSKALTDRALMRHKDYD